MKVLGIIGSPRGDQGRSHQVVSGVLAGAQATGAETGALYLIDEEPEYCAHCGTRRVRIAQTWCFVKANN